jgi:hypothetical protein
VSANKVLFLQEQRAEGPSQLLGKNLIQRSIKVFFSPIAPSLTGGVGVTAQSKLLSFRSTKSLVTAAF